MTKLELTQLIKQYREDYLDKPDGQKHIAHAEAEAKEVKKVFAQIKKDYAADDDITDSVLQRLLPHHDTEFHRNNNYRISTWPCIIRDVRGWFEGAGWKEPEEWQPTARLLFEAIDGIINGNLKPWHHFIESPYRHGFGTGFVTPILFCLDNQFPIINSKVVKTYKFCTTHLGHKGEIDASLANYLENAEKVKALQSKLASFGLDSLLHFDFFCHYVVDKRLGGGDLTKVDTPSLNYEGWFFVANPDIFLWEQAFENGGVDWTGSKGAYAQKLIREQMKKGDPVFGYQAGPYYEVRCKLIIGSTPFKTPDGNWAITLNPVHQFQNPISLSTLQKHPVLSKIKFIQQTQMSISGLTARQLTVLESLISEAEDGSKGQPVPIELVEETLSTVDHICKALKEAQHDTKNPDIFEQHLANAFAFLGLETDHVGGPGNADVVATAQLGNDSYTTIIDAKTRKPGHALNDVNFHSIQDHRAENTADYALIVAPAFSGGKLVNHAMQDGVGLLTTDQLITLLRHHDRFPFTLAELRDLFATHGPANGVVKVLERVHVQHDEYLQIASNVLAIFEEFQRQHIPSQPINSSAITLLLLQEAKKEGNTPPTSQQVDTVLDFLANKVVDILEEEKEGYVLTISPKAAGKRLFAIASLLADQNPNN